MKTGFVVSSEEGQLSFLCRDMEEDKLIADFGESLYNCHIYKAPEHAGFVSNLLNSEGYETWVTAVEIVENPAGMALKLGHKVKVPTALPAELPRVIPTLFSGEIKGKFAEQKTKPKAVEA